MLKKYFSVLIILGLFLNGCAEVQKADGGVEVRGAIGSALLGGSGVRTYGVARYSSVQAMSPGTLSGYVYDAITDDPIQGIMVYTSITNIATTDANGYYSLSGVPAGDVLVRTASTISSSPKPCTHDYHNVGIVTSASNVDFYLYPMTSYLNASTGDLNVTVKDGNGAPIQGMAVVVYSDTYGTTEKAITTDNSGEANFADIRAGDLIITAGALFAGGYITKTLSAGTTAAAALQIPLDQATVEGTVTMPSGLSFYEGWSGSLGPELNGWYTLAGINSGTYEGDAYSVLSQPGGNYNLRVTARSSDYKKQSFAFDSDLTIATGATITRNFALPATPSSITVSTSESGGNPSATISWSAPSDWTPDYYIVWYNLIDDYNYSVSYIITTDTSIYFEGQLNYSSLAVVAVESAGMDINNMNLMNIKISRMSLNSL